MGQKQHVDRRPELASATPGQCTEGCCQNTSDAATDFTSALSAAYVSVPTNPS
ncbi:MAG: hypothetical protein AAGC93_09365 [Cyanobacteria bacterium P01_F01_bin.53]